MIKLLFFVLLFFFFFFLWSQLIMGMDKIRASEVLSDAGLKSIYFLTVEAFQSHIVTETRHVAGLSKIFPK